MENFISKDRIWIETYTGKIVNPLDLKDADICIEDIAASLSKLCRYTGHCSHFYSVGQHSLYVSYLVRDALNQKTLTMSPADIDRTSLAALLHDGAEAYTNDISRPVKYAVKGFREIEKVIEGKIMQHFGCTGVDWELIKAWDDTMLATEAYQFMKSKGDNWYLPRPRINFDIMEFPFKIIEDNFLNRFHTWGGQA